MWVGFFAAQLVAVGDDSSEVSIIDTDDHTPAAILVGSSLVNSNHLTCTFYDLTRESRGRMIAMNHEALDESLVRFIRSGWESSKLARYYRSPQKRYATTVMIPPVEAWAISTAFGEEDTLGSLWLLLYEGTLVHPSGITFRFRGAAEDGIVVRVGDRIVLSDKVFSSEKGLAEEFSKVWKSSDEQTGKFYLGKTPATVGDWITLEPGVPVEIKIVVAEASDAISSAMLLVEEKGVQYPDNQQGGPILPIFKMDALPLGFIDQVCLRLPAGEAALEGGPVFGGGSGLVSNTGVSVQGSLNVMDESSGSGLRIWTGDNGSVLEASVEGISGKMVILKDAAGKTRRIPVERLSKADQRYIALVHEQKYSVAFETTRESQKILRYVDSDRIMKQYNYIFSASAKQMRSAKETYDLVGELYVLTQEQQGDAYILMAREELSFVSRRNAGPSVVISTKPICMIDEQYGEKLREENEFSYLFIIKDADGAVISHSSSEPWLFPNLGNLQQQPVGAFLDQACNRVLPSRPEPTAY